MGMGQKDDNQPTAAAVRNKAKILAFLTDFDNDWPKRSEYSLKILGYKSVNQIYRTLSPQDITAIEAEALEIIKANSTPQRKELYKSLFKEGKAGNVTAIKEFLDRTEGKVKEVKEITGKDGGKIQVEHSSIDLGGAKAAFDG
jgi:hypothetical protein